MEVKKILAEIEEIQSLPYQNWISALGRKKKVEILHEKLDKLNYNGNRPPKFWRQIKPNKVK